MPVLSLKNATFSQGNNLLLGPITLDLDLTGITAILGANGAGKSLFLTLCHGMIPAQSGQITWNEIPAQHSRATRGFMLQSAVVLRRTVFANIDFALHSTGVHHSLRADRIKEALNQVHLLDKSANPAATLSGGELRRLMLARALVTKPKVLLLDEPFAGLDPIASEMIEDIIARVANETPILMSSHDLPQVKRRAHRILFFDGGKLIETDLAKAFFSGPKTPQARSFLTG